MSKTTEELRQEQQGNQELADELEQWLDPANKDTESSRTYPELMRAAIEALRAKPRYVMVLDSVGRYRSMTNHHEEFLEEQLEAARDLNYVALRIGKRMQCEMDGYKACAKELRRELSETRRLYDASVAEAVRKAQVGMRHADHADEAEQELAKWKQLIAQLGGDDTTINDCTPNDLAEHVTFMEKRERACVAYKVLEALGLDEVLLREAAQSPDYNIVVNRAIMMASNVRQELEKTRTELTKCTCSCDEQDECCPQHGRSIQEIAIERNRWTRECVEARARLTEVEAERIAALRALNKELEAADCSRCAELRPLAAAMFLPRRTPLFKALAALEKAADDLSPETCTWAKEQNDD